MFEFSDLFHSLDKEEFQKHINSNHELARKHLIDCGLNDSVEYIFKREWNGSPGKLSTETPLVRWHYMKKV